MFDSNAGGHHAAPAPLSLCSGAVSAAVIWAAFGVSHLTFVVQSDVAGLAAFEEPLICVYGASDGSETGRTRTLWVTFLACAFLLPLTIVCGLSAAVLRFQQRRRRQCHVPEGSGPTVCTRRADSRGATTGYSFIL